MNLKEQNHHFILGTILISMIVKENADEETLKSLRNDEKTEAGTI